MHYRCPLQRQYANSIVTLILMCSVLANCDGYKAQVQIRERVSVSPRHPHNPGIQFNASGIVPGDTAECTIAIINAAQIYSPNGSPYVFLNKSGAFQVSAEDTQRVLVHGGLLVGVNLPGGREYGIGADDSLTLDINGTRVITFGYQEPGGFLDPMDAGIDIHQAVHPDNNSYHAVAWDTEFGADYGVPPLRITIPTSLRFQVTFTRDTIQYGDTSAITVVAVDGNNNEVTIPGNTPLIFSATQDVDTLWSYFIDPAGLRQFSPLENVAYSDARASKVKFLANNALWNYASGNLHASFVRVEGGRRVGYKYLQVGAAKLKFDGVDSADVFPHYAGHNLDSTTSDTVGLTLQSVWGGSTVPAKFIEVKISPPVLSDSGGHSHAGSRPKGKFQIKNGSSWFTVDSSIQSTDQNGILHFRFKSSEFGGIEVVRVTPTHPSPGVQAQKRLRTIVKNLVKLNPGNNYVLTGAPDNYAQTNDPCRPTPPTSQHYNNHYGTPACVQMLVQLANEYASVYPGIRIRINDMSLIFGGLFDVDNNWHTDHKEHRLGRNADIGYLKGVDSDGNCVDVHERPLRFIIDGYFPGKTYRHTDEPHFHVRLY